MHDDPRPKTPVADRAGAGPAVAGSRVQTGPRARRPVRPP